jgi:hypothetical protein
VRTCAFAACPGNRHALRVVSTTAAQFNLASKMLSVACSGICSYGSCQVGRHSRLSIFIWIPPYQSLSKIEGVALYLLL